MVRAILFASLIGLTACGAAQPLEDDYVAIPLTSSTVQTKAPPPIEEKSPDELNDDQKAQIKVALRRGGEKSAQCNKVTGSNVAGTGNVDVVVDGAVGKVTDAVVGAPFAGTAVEDCIKRSFVGEYALTFPGKLTIPYEITLSAAAEPAKKDPKKK